MKMIAGDDKHFVVGIAEDERVRKTVHEHAPQIAVNARVQFRGDSCGNCGVANSIQESVGKADVSVRIPACGLGNLQVCRRRPENAVVRVRDHRPSAIGELS